MNQPEISAVRVELVAVVMAVEADRPRVLSSGDPLQLPAGPLRDDQASLQASVREFVLQQAGHRLGFVEQLYTFADAGRAAAAPDAGADREVSISYLGLTRPGSTSAWTDIYDVLPWEDRRGRTGLAAERREHMLEALTAWAAGPKDSGPGGIRLETGETSHPAAAGAGRASRVDFLFGRDGHPWRPEMALQRYELLWEAGLVPESGDAAVASLTGPAMYADHRRILATGLARLRATLQYRPVVFELVPESFTLGRLQEVVEALAGNTVHTQNFRRVVENQHGLVEPTGAVEPRTGGRPARLYRFRRSVFTERDLVGTKLPVHRSR
ncbi:MAG: NUDIX hydrolase [Nostocoides sp.]